MQARKRSRPRRFDLWFVITIAAYPGLNPKGNAEMYITSDMNVLYDAFRAAMKGSSWKNEPQKFERDFLSQLVQIHDELEDRTYKTLPTNEFITYERGKERLIHGGRMRDRVVRHALCDNVLNEMMKPYIIHNNSASQKNKGVDFARRQFEYDLHNYWLEHRTNDGWVCFIDFSKFYDNIRHDKVKEMICPKIDGHSAWLFSSIIDNFQVDVSYMGDDQYQNCLLDKFDSIEYYKAIPKELRTGKKYMSKSVDIGDQVSQSIGVFYPTEIDNYITIVRGHRRVGRYMDDINIIHHDRGYLEDTLKGICEIADRLGLYINHRKTRVCKLSGIYTYLQMRYSLTETGRVIRRINPKAVTRQRRKLKAYRNLMDKGELPYKTVKDEYKSWMAKYTHYMSKLQIRNMKQLYYQLFKEDPRWKKSTR